MAVSDRGIGLDLSEIRWNSFSLDDLVLNIKHQTNSKYIWYMMTVRWFNIKRSSKESKRLVYCQPHQIRMAYINTPFERSFMCSRGLYSLRSRNLALTNCHPGDVMVRAIAAQITGLTIVYSTVYSGAQKRKYQSPVSLAFVTEIHRWPVNFPHKGPVTPKIFYLMTSPWECIILVVSLWTFSRMCSALVPPCDLRCSRKKGSCRHSQLRNVLCLKNAAFGASRCFCNSSQNWIDVIKN